MQNHFENEQTLHAGKRQEKHECINALQRMGEADYNHEVITQGMKEQGQMAAQAMNYPVLSVISHSTQPARHEVMTELLACAKADPAFRELLLAEVNAHQRRAEVLAWLESLSNEELEFVIGYLKGKQQESA